jgi:hypothetical protein
VAIIAVPNPSAAGSTVLYNKGSYGTASNGVMAGTSYNYVANSVALPAINGVAITVPFNTTALYVSFISRMAVTSYASATTVLTSTLGSNQLYTVVDPASGVFMFVANTNKFYLAPLGGAPYSGANLSLFTTCAASGLFCYGSYLV